MLNQDIKKRLKKITFIYFNKITISTQFNLLAIGNKILKTKTYFLEKNIMNITLQ